MRTPLYGIHRELSARFFSFHGWEMPLEFESAVKEALAVRESAGLFDISHMGRIWVEGRSAGKLLELLTTNSLSGLTEGRVRYTLFTSERGTVLDDATVYVFSPDSYFLCVNAVNREKILRWLEMWRKRLGLTDLTVRDVSAQTVQIALQGPASRNILSEHFDLEGLKYYRFRTFGDVFISRTGYTGEDGFEIYAPVEKGVELYRELVRSAKPCGLSARDILRIEAGFPLYGNEISEEITPLDAGLDRFVDLSKEFVGREELVGREPTRKLVGLELSGKGIPRRGYRILLHSREVGKVSSGTYSPTLGKGIALAFVKPEVKEGTQVSLEIRSRHVPATITRPRFV